MGSAFFIRSERDAGLDLSMDGKALAMNESALSARCDDLGVPELLRFVSPSAEQQLAAAEEFGLDDIEPVPEQWFDAAEGLLTIRALHGVVSSQAEWFTASDALLHDLARSEHILVSLERLGIRWHFDVDY